MSTATYDDGRKVGTHKALADLVANRAIAVQYARARLDAIANRQGRTDYSKGYLDGYRSVLTETVKRG